MDLAALLPFQTLVDGAVLGVYGKERRLVAAGRRRHEAARHDKGLLVGDGHGLAGFDGGHGRQETGAAYDRRKYNVRFELAGKGNEAAGAPEDFRARVPEGPGERIHRALVGQRDRARPVSATELGHHMGIGASGRQAFDTELLREVGDELEGALPHRTRGPEHGQPFHAWRARP